MNVSLKPSGEPGSSRKRKRSGSACEHSAAHLRPALFSSSEEAATVRADVDYTRRISMEEAKSGSAPRQVRVYADGIYDMFHSGHSRQLMQAKALLPNTYLLVGICDDNLTHNSKGRTVMNEAERYEAVRHCRYVDEVITSAPWTITDEFLEKHKIDFVAHDDLPYGSIGADDIYKSLKDKGMFLATQRTEGISTTDVISRIIKDYDMYVRRNLSRGYSRQELNVGFLKEKRLKVGMKLDAIKEKFEQRRNNLFEKWEEMSRDFVINFTDMFGRDGLLNTWIADAKERVVVAISPPNSPRRLKESGEMESDSEEEDQFVNGEDSDQMEVPTN